MPRLEPLPEHIAFSDSKGITRRWMGWLRTLQQRVGETLDLEVLQAFSELNSADAFPAVDELRALEAFGQTPAPVNLGPLETLQALVPNARSWSEIQCGQDTFANRTLYPAAAQPEGSFFRATDKLVIWQKRIVSGTAAWVYVAGIWRDTLANIPTASLGTNDAGLLFEATDYSHLLRWSGSAWTWGPGELGAGRIEFFLAAPSGLGAAAWQLCDGSTVARLNADGTTTNVAVPDYSTPAYLKAATTATAGPTAASGTTADTTATNQSNTTGITVSDHASHTHDIASSLATPDLFAADTSGAGVSGRTGGPSATLSHTVNDPGHNHTQDAHHHAPGTLELRRTELLAYYRR